MTTQQSNTKLTMPIEDTIILNSKKCNAQLLTIHADGRITVSEDCKPTETAAEVLQIMREQWLADIQSKKIGEQEQRIKRLEELVSWRPIESAPHDMTWVIGCDEKDGECGTIIFDRVVEPGESHEEQCHYEWTDGMRRWEPTHWMPLPEPPKSKEAKP